MANHTRRRQTGGFPFYTEEHSAKPLQGSEARLNAIISSVKTTRDDLEKELSVYAKKMTLLETEFVQYQKMAVKVMAAIDVFDGAEKKLMEEDATSIGNEPDSPPPK